MRFVIGIPNSKSRVKKCRLWLQQSSDGAVHLRACEEEDTSGTGYYLLTFGPDFKVEAIGSLHDTGEFLPVTPDGYLDIQKG